MTRRGEQRAFPGDDVVSDDLGPGKAVRLDVSSRRIFSLMNNIKTADRSTMGQQNLRNLMLWHEMAKQLEPEEVPVMAILKEFREMAGPAGRKSHRPSNPVIRGDTVKQNR